MNCPSCQNPLVVLEFDRIEVDYCVSCGGVWLDAGELGLLLDGAENRDQLMAGLDADVEGKEKRIRCPMCSKKMRKVLCGLIDEEEMRLRRALGDYPDVRAALG